MARNNRMIYGSEKMIIGDCLTTQELRDKYCIYDSFEKDVEKYDFFRIHSAFLINLEYVDKMLENGFVLVDNASLPIAQRRIQNFKKIYMDYIRRSFGT